LVRRTAKSAARQFVEISIAMQQGDTKRRNFCEAANSGLSYLSSSR
jgi:hypothetical protein